MSEQTNLAAPSTAADVMRRQCPGCLRRTADGGGHGVLLRVLLLSRMAAEGFTWTGLGLWQPCALVMRCRPGRCR